MGSFDSSKLSLLLIVFMTISFLLGFSSPRKHFVFSRARLWRDVSPAQDEARSEAEDARSIFEASDSAGAMHYFRQKVRFEKT